MKTGHFTLELNNSFFFQKYTEMLCTFFVNVLMYLFYLVTNVFVKELVIVSMWNVDFGKNKV